MSCEEYRLQGYCKYGIDCRFSHDDPDEEEQQQSQGCLVVSCDDTIGEYGDEDEEEQDECEYEDDEKEEDEGEDEYEEDPRERGESFDGLDGHRIRFGKEVVVTRKDYKFKEVVKFPAPFSKASSSYHLVKGSKSGEFVEPILGFKYCPLKRTYTSPDGKVYQFEPPVPGSDSNGSFKEIVVALQKSPHPKGDVVETGKDDGQDLLDPSRRPVVMSLKSGKNKRKVVPLGPRAHQQGSASSSSSAVQKPSSSASSIRAGVEQASEFEIFFANEERGESSVDDKSNDTRGEDERLARVLKAREAFLHGDTAPPPIQAHSGNKRGREEKRERDRKKGKKADSNEKAPALVEDRGNKGNQLLRKMGWGGSGGLGKDSAGIASSDVVTKPHEANSRSGRNARGLGMSPKANPSHGKRRERREGSGKETKPMKRSWVGQYAKEGAKTTRERYEALSQANQKTKL